MCADLRPVFPEERLLLEILQGKPLAYVNDSVWASNNRYYINGKAIAITTKLYKKMSPELIRDQLGKFKAKNSSPFFEKTIKNFIALNKDRFNHIVDEAHSFIEDTAKKYPRECVVISFSGGKDSSVTADLTIKALRDPSLVHIFGNTTLEFPLTIEYVERYRKENSKSIFKNAINREQDFYSICEDIGPPARMLRWCCSMFKTGPITRVLNSMYRDKNILTFYGIRKCESVSRKSNRIKGLLHIVSADPNDAIRGSEFYGENPIQHVFTYYIKLAVLEESIRCLAICEKVVVEKYSGAITTEDIALVDKPSGKYKKQRTRA